MWGPLGTLTPGTGNTGSLAEIAQPLVFEPLARFDANGGLLPVVASRIEPTSQHAVRVWLRKESTFSDGTALTDNDVVESFAGKARMTRDGDALVIESLDPGTPIEILLTNVLIHRGSGDRALGTGRFVVVAADGSELRMVRRQPTPRKVSEVRLVPYATPKEAFAHTLKGDANLLVDVDPRWVEFFRDVPTLQLVRSPGRSTDAVVFNMKLPRAERKALAAVLETDEVRNVAYGAGECAEMPGGAARVRVPPGPRLGVLTWGPFERLGRVVRRTLGPRAGELVHLPPRELLARMRSHDFDLVALRPLSWPPAMMSLSWHSGTPDNTNGYANPDVDRALDAHQWAAARAALRDDPPAAFICTRDRLAVLDARIKNPAVGSGTLMETLPEWEVAE
ncbi:MAG TPA: hypothetical protein VI356_12515, partial [Myxococcales bacterium]